MKLALSARHFPGTGDRDDRRAGQASTFLIEDYTVAPALLGHIEATVCAAEHLRVRFVLGCRSNTDTDRQRINLIFGRMKRRVFYFRAYALCNAHTCFATGARQKNAEFLSTDTSDKVAFSRHILKREGDQFQRTVANAMAERKTSLDALST